MGEAYHAASAAHHAADDIFLNAVVHQRDCKLTLAANLPLRAGDLRDKRMRQFLYLRQVRLNIDASHHRTALADFQNQLARIDIGDERTAILRHPAAQVFKTPLLRLVKAGHKGCVRPHPPSLKIFLVHPIDADWGEGKDDYLTVIGRVGQRLRIAAGGCGKDDFALHGGLYISIAGPYRTVAQRQINSLLHRSRTPSLFYKQNEPEYMFCLFIDFTNRSKFQSIIALKYNTSTPFADIFCR